LFARKVAFFPAIARRQAPLALSFQKYSSLSKSSGKPFTPLGNFPLFSASIQLSFRFFTRSFSALRSFALAALSL